ncbi:cytochrome P450 [Basidiobolus meristosporus CBS 931.73]|uniref:NADPH--hemoprotein reductase n=1 Tax=Basidiobolus meristosporus CBS 931.73 TaxID=1314790 RepID=A0A1Y1ZB97_9FUNG|nr:cytochrome P450 [Basidiobolus meristosporus CBS 931.73]|eukprot:ORY07247.1 cytochrome P450 [Basidiobolus meristosporus CBS 931.73]
MTELYSKEAFQVNLPNTEQDTSPGIDPKILVIAFAGEDEASNGIIVKIQSDGSLEDVRKECGERMSVPRHQDIEFRDKYGRELSSYKQLASMDVVYLTIGGASSREIPTPPTVPLFGTIPHLLPDIVGSLFKFFQEYDTPLLQTFNFQTRTLTTNHPDIAELFAQETEYFTKRITLPFAEVKAIGGDGLFTTSSDEEIWKLAHKLLMPAFSAAAMKAYAHEMALLAKKLVNVVSEISTEPEPVLIAPWMTKITFETIGKVGFGFDFGLLESKDAPIHPFIDAMSFCLREVRTRATRSQYWKKLPIWSNYQFDRMMQLMKDTVDDVIIQRKNSPDAQNSSKDLLGFMLNARDKATGQKLPDEVIRDQVVTFLIAGHETTSNTLAWCLYNLARHPAALKKVLQELANIGIADDELPTIAQVSGMKYLSQVLKETLRMYPPLASLQKFCIKDCKLPFGYAIEKGTVAQINIYSLHHNPNIWKDPEVFNPDRFTSVEESKRSRYSWLPFSTGPRACIGMQFALQEAKIILAMLLKKFEFILPDDRPIHYDISSGNIIKPKDLYFRIQPRASFPKATTQIQSESTTPFTELTSALTLPSLPSDVKLPKFTVLFGSNMGMSEEYANKVASNARNLGFKEVEVTPLDDWELLISGKYTGGAEEDSQSKPIVLVITSTYNGLPPDNAVHFDKFISAPTNVNETPLKGLRYAVFGCGNVQWRTYQAFPKKVNDRFEYLGAEQLFPAGAGNADADIDADFTEWLARFYASILSDFGLNGANLSSIANTAASNPTEGVSLKYLPLTDIPLQQGLEQPSIVCKNLELQSVKSERSTRHLEIELPEKQTYNTGDHLEIMPENDSEVVETVAATFGYALDAVFEVIIDSTSSTSLSSRSLAASIKGPCTIRDALTYYADLQAAPSRQFIGICVSAIADTHPELEKKYFENMCQSGDKGNEAYLQFIKKNRCLMDLIRNFPMIKKLDFRSFLCGMPAMTKRRYSIASCPQIHKNVAHICVGVTEDIGFEGRKYIGLCSGFLSRCMTGRQVRANVRGVKEIFHLPKDPKVPVIMVCAGTGVSPFRGFLQERQLYGCKSVGKGGISETHMFFGCRSPEQDFIYREELEEFVNDGTLDKLVVAFSRTGQAKKYVQHQLLAHSVLVWDVVHNKQGAIYVCGSASGMAKDVAATMVSIFEQVGGLGREEADKYFQQLQHDGKYNEDVWG